MGCIDKAGQELYTFSKDFGLEALSPGRTAENIFEAETRVDAFIRKMLDLPGTPRA